MEREILFRGKRIDNGEWIYGDRVRRYPKICIATCGEAFPCEVYSETVGQYTGLTDRNGSRIFEGDRCVVTRVGALAYGVIIFHQGCFIFKENSTENLLRLCDIAINGYQIRVQGDIHDNPEMLKE